MILFSRKRGKKNIGIIINTYKKKPSFRAELKSLNKLMVVKVKVKELKIV